MKTLFTIAVIALLLPTSLVAAQPQANPKAQVGINVVLNTEVSPAILSQLGKLGKVRDVVASIRGVTMQIPAYQFEAVRALPFVAAANPDATRDGAPVDGVPVADFANGLSTWNLDLINVTDFGKDRQVEQDGAGVYIAVLDTGLVDLWRMYFPQERIASQYGACFGGGGGEMGTVSLQPNKWEHDQSSHGTHVTSTILGFRLGAVSINGVAPKATVIPVKVLNQNGKGWSSVIARGITYIAELKAGPLADFPVVINMSLGGPVLDALEQAAIDYAISQGVIIVASAGNNGPGAMGYPGAYPPVISVGACGWTGEWSIQSWWISADVEDPCDVSKLYICDFSSQAVTGQDLDVVAPGSWVVGPYQVNSGQISYYYLGGTSMAAPHVAGLVALMAQKNPALTAVNAEGILESTATVLGNQNFVEGAGLVDAKAALAW
jgi:subtilisin